MRWRRVIGVVVAVVACVGVIALNWPRSESNTATAAPPTTTTTTTSTTTTTVPKPEHPFEAADAVVPEVKLYDAPGATDSSSSLPNPTVEKVPLAFMVKQHGPPGWLQVQIARRPNESTAWIHAEDVALRGVDNRILIEREAHRLTVYKGTTDEVLFQTTVADGAPATPTPLGNFFIDIVVKLSQTTGAYGPYQLSVAGFSDVLQSFGGGPGQIAIHGTNHPELIGKFVSNGCIRLKNDDIIALADMAPVGTPVQIVA
jgi:lipoprotein-anchoring transpeptidase ErfK/SrfK